MSKNKKGISIIVLMIALLFIVFVITIMLMQVQKHNDFLGEIEETEVNDEVSKLQTKLDISKMTIFTKLGKEVAPDNKIFEGKYKKVENTDYYSVDKSEYSKISKDGIMYMTEDYEYIFLTQKGNIYPKDLNLSGIQLVNEVPEGYTAISTADELQKITGDGKYILMSDIDLEKTNFVPIKDFNGILDGNGHIIKNLNYKAENLSKNLMKWTEDVYYGKIDEMLELELGSSKEQNSKYLSKINHMLKTKYKENRYVLEAAKDIYAKDGYALFENTLENSVIKNLTIDNFNIVSNNCVSGLVEVLGGKIKNVTAKNINLKGLKNVGALAGTSVGSNVTKIQSCIVKNEVKNNIEGTAFAGGLIGNAIYTDISDSNYEGVGSIIISDMAGGGIAGSAIGSEIVNSKADTQLVSLKGSYNNNYTWLGGLIGYAKDANISYSSANTNIYSSVSKMKYVGGLIGSAADTDINSSFATGRISNVNSYSGGLAGSIDIEGKNKVEINKSYANVDISSLDRVASGLIGVTRSNNNINANNKIVISKCYSLGNINTAIAGSGFISWVDGNIDIENSYTSSNVNSRIKDEGSFIATLNAKKANISNVYASGYVNSGNTTKVFGKVENKSGLNVKHCYYDTKDNAEVNEYGLPVKTTLMTMQESFKGFDFKNTWTTKSDTSAPELMI